jgi:hypothetical protein
MRLNWLTFIAGTIPLYVYLGWRIQISWLNFPNAGKTFVILGVLNLFFFLWFLQKRYLPALEAMRQSEDISNVRRWIARWTFLLYTANCLVAVGLLFRMGGGTLQQSVPFYTVGLLLILSLWPRQI